MRRGVPSWTWPAPRWRCGERSPGRRSSGTSSGTGGARRPGPLLPGGGAAKRGPCPRAGGIPYCYVDRARPDHSCPTRRQPTTVPRRSPSATSPPHRTAPRPGLRRRAPRRRHPRPSGPPRAGRPVEIVTADAGRTHGPPPLRLPRHGRGGSSGSGPTRCWPSGRRSRTASTTTSISRTRSLPRTSPPSKRRWRRSSRPTPLSSVASSTAPRSSKRPAPRVIATRPSFSTDFPRGRKSPSTATRGPIRGPLPRPARAFHRLDQGLQAAARGRCLLAGRRAQPDAAAGLRHRVLDKKDLKAHLERLEEARKRDHRKLGRELGLFTFHPEAPAIPFFLPKGAVIYNRLEDYIRELYRRYGYQEVITPQILDVSLWNHSGHYEHYQTTCTSPRSSDRNSRVKPMNCPGHSLMFGRTSPRTATSPSAGRLRPPPPLRAVRRHLGMTRVRSFSQDDAHIFCMPEQVESEIAGSSG